MTTIINGSSPSITFSDGSAQTSATRPFLNRIINGAMVIDQRNAGASITANDGTYPVDRFRFTMSASSKGTGQQQTSVVPVGFSNALVFTSTAATSLGSTDFYCFEQYIEGFNVADLDWGSANAKTVTLSFQVRSSLTGTFGGSLQNGDSTRSYPFTYTISSANTWTTASVTIAGDTTGTWLKTNGTGIKVCFGLGTGSTRSGTAGTWASAWYPSATGAVSVVGTNGATWYITGVQLEVGSTATSFDYRPYGTELQLCQRYTQVRRGGEGSNSAITFCGTGNARNTTTWFGADKFSVTMRTFPSLTVTNPTSFQLYNTSGIATTAISYDISDRDYMLASVGGTPGSLTTSQFYTLTTNNANALLVYSAEL